MMNKKDLLHKFNNGKLTEEEANALELMFVNDNLSIDEFEIYNSYEANIEDDEIDFSLNHRIQDLISEEVNKQRIKDHKKHWFSFLPLPVKLAFPLVLLLCGFFAGKSFQNGNVQSFVDVKNPQIGNMQMVNDILYHPSSSQRLTLVNNANYIGNDEEQITRLLFMSLNHDESANVRMAAVDALMLHSDKPSVREGLIKSINQQETTIMKKYIAEALSIIGEKIISSSKDRNDVMPINKTIKALETKVY